jgi:hypothetical protein
MAALQGDNAIKNSIVSRKIGRRVIIGKDPPSGSQISSGLKVFNLTGTADAERMKNGKRLI